MKHLPLLLAATLLSANLAMAQDADEYAVEPVIPGENDAAASESYDWSGSFFGVSAALALGSHDTLGIGGIDSSSNDLSGYALGGQMGQNYQITRIVLGSEMDFSLAEISGPFELDGSPVACDMAGFTCASNIEWFGSLRGRAGVSLGRLLPYVTGGIAGAGVRTDFEGPGIDTQMGGLAFGWVAGAGLEFAVMDNIVLRGEALHYDLNDVSDEVLGTNVSTDARFTVLRTGINLKF